MLHFTTVAAIFAVGNLFVCLPYGDMRSQGADDQSFFRGRSKRGPIPRTISSRRPDSESGVSFQFGYRAEGQQKSNHFRQEYRDNNGVIRGSYGFRTPLGLFRLVHYVADAHGFRAIIRSNEPGLGKQNPADVDIMKTPSQGSVEETPIIRRQYQSTLDTAIKVNDGFKTFPEGSMFAIRSAVGNRLQRKHFLAPDAEKTNLRTDALRVSLTADGTQEHKPTRTFSAKPTPIASRRKITVPLSTVAKIPPKVPSDLTEAEVQSIFQDRLSSLAVIQRQQETKSETAMNLGKNLTKISIEKPVVKTSDSDSLRSSGVPTDTHHDINPAPDDTNKQEADGKNSQKNNAPANDANIKTLVSSLAPDEEDMTSSLNEATESNDSSCFEDCHYHHPKISCLCDKNKNAPNEVSVSEEQQVKSFSTVQGITDHDPSEPSLKKSNATTEDHSIKRDNDSKNWSILAFPFPTPANVLPSSLQTKPKQNKEEFSRNSDGMPFPHLLLSQSFGIYPYVNKQQINPPSSTPHVSLIPVQTKATDRDVIHDGVVQSRILGQKTIFRNTFESHVRNVPVRTHFPNSHQFSVFSPPLSSSLFFPHVPQPLSKDRTRFLFGNSLQHPSLHGLPRQEKQELAVENQNEGSKLKDSAAVVNIKYSRTDQTNPNIPNFPTNHVTKSEDKLQNPRTHQTSLTIPYFPRNHATKPEEKPQNPRTHQTDLNIPNFYTSHATTSEEKLQNQRTHQTSLTIPYFPRNHATKPEEKPQNPRTHQTDLNIPNFHTSHATTSEEKLQNPRTHQTSLNISNFPSKHVAKSEEKSRNPNSEISSGVISASGLFSLGSEHHSKNSPTETVPIKRTSTQQDNDSKSLPNSSSYQTRQFALNSSDLLSKEEEDETSKANLQGKNEKTAPDAHIYPPVTFSQPHNQEERYTVLSLKDDCKKEIIEFPLNPQVSSTKDIIRSSNEESEEQNVAFDDTNEKKPKFQNVGYGGLTYPGQLKYPDAVSMLPPDFRPSSLPDIPHLESRHHHHPFHKLSRSERPLFNSRGVQIKPDDVPIHLHRYIPTKGSPFILGTDSRPMKLSIPRPVPPSGVVIPPRPYSGHLPRN